MNFILNLLLAILLMLFISVANFLKLIEYLVFGKPKPYSLEPEQNRLLALAHPMAEKHIERGYAEVNTEPSIFDEYEKTLRPVTLHFFGLSNDLEDEAIRAVLSERLKTWFSMDLDVLHPSDNPRNAMAFACARLAFSVRASTLLGWLDEDTQWRVLTQNNQRAKDCFVNWHDYGQALSQGRKQWVKRSRADSLGVPFNEELLNEWLQNKKHPWCFLHW